MPEKRKPSAAYLERRAKGIAAGKTAEAKPEKKYRNVDPESEAVQGGFITSLENDKAKFVRLLLNKRERYASRHFMLEGIKLFAEALKAGANPTFTLYEPETLRKTEAGRGMLLVLADRVAEKKSTYPVTEKIIASVSDTVTPQGLSAAVPFLQWPDEKLAEKRLHLVLDGLQDPGNLGTIMRSAWAAGNAAVWLTEGSVDVYSPKVVRAGMGAHFHVPTRFDQKWPEMLKNLAKLGVVQILLAEGELTEEGEAKANYSDLPIVSIYEVDWSKPTALIIGNEAHGPGRESWKAANKLVNIPMPGGAESLNAAIATSLCIFEALRQQGL